MRDSWAVISSKYNDQFPELIKLAQIATIIPVSTADCKRGFSYQNRTKIKSRARLSGKTVDFMIIKSARKRDMEISLNISNSDGSSHVLERKQCIKYLGVMIDESLTWKHHITFVSKYRNHVEIEVLFIYSAIKTNLL